MDLTGFPPGADGPLSAHANGAGEAIAHAARVLAGYARLEHFDSAPGSLVFRAIDLADDAPVFLRIARDDAEAAGGRDTLAREFALLRGLDDPAVPRALALQEGPGSCVLVLEDSGGQRLSRMLDARPVPVDRFFPLAIALATALDRLHRHGITHGSFQPRQLLYDAAACRVMTVGLPTAFRTPQAPSRPFATDAPREDLVHLAPEQTGRMNRPVDWRADLYALGVTLYRLLAGHPPFESADPLELVYGHLARVPPPLGETRDDLPAGLAPMVSRLLAKHPEDRYQSTGGLLADLRRCRDQWRAGLDTPFELGTDDVPRQFGLSRRLYGREAEVAELRAALDRVCVDRRPEWILVTGQSGIGKTRLFAELLRPLAARRGWLASGRVEPYRADAPYAVWLEAIRGLIDQLLSLPADALATWRDRLHAEIGGDVGLLADLVAPLRRLLPGPLAAPEIGPAEARRRTLAALQRLITLFARPDHPLVLCLDDLQWADEDSLALLERLADGAAGTSLVLIAACRDNEPGGLQRLQRLTQVLAANRLRTTRLALQPLTVEHVAQLLADTLHRDRDDTRALADVVSRKTHGNPLFTCQFLESLHRDGLIEFDAGHRRWRWDTARIAARPLADNVADLMVAEIGRLPAPTRTLVAVAALLGSRVRLTVFARAVVRTPAAIAEGLTPAVEAGLLSCDATTCAFLHDRVLDAARALLLPGERVTLQWRIGCRLMHGLAEPELTGHEYLIADLLEQGAAAGTGPREAASRAAAAQLGQRLGERALAACAYGPAMRHFVTGLDLLDGGRWQEDYALTFGLTAGLARSAWLAGETELAASNVEVLQRHARDVVDWARAARIGIGLQVDQRNLEAACDEGLRCLARLGMVLPEHPSDAEIAATRDEHFRLLAGRDIGSLSELPPMTDPAALAAMQVIAALHSVFFYVRRPLFDLLIGRTMLLIQTHGRAAGTTAALAFFGYMLSSRFLDHRTGHRYVQLAERLHQQARAPKPDPAILYCAGLVGAWLEPLRTSADRIEQARQRNVEIGDLVTAVVCAQRRLAAGLALGEPLDALQARADALIESAKAVNFSQGLDLLLARRQLIRALRGETRGLGTLDGADFDLAAFERRTLPHDGWLFTSVFHLLVAQACYLAGDFGGGAQAAARVVPVIDQIAGLQHVHDYYLYDVLCSAATMDRLDDASRARERARLENHAARLDAWAGLNAATFLPGGLLTRAALLRVDGRASEAVERFDQAAEAARAGGFVHLEGIAHEQSASLSDQLGRTLAADTSLRAARAAYARWGATAKVREIDLRHPTLAPAAPTGPGEGGLARLDAMAIVGAFRALSSRTDADGRLRELLTTVVRHSGADYGALLQAADGHLVLAAQADLDGDTLRVDLAGETPPPARVVSPQALLHYVWNTGERVLVDDTDHPAPRDDPAFARLPRASLLALRVAGPSRAIGVLWLCNRRATHAFTDTTADVVEQLVRQAAISMENSRLLAEVQDLRRQLGQRRAEPGLAGPPTEPDVQSASGRPR